MFRKCCFYSDDAFIPPLRQISDYVPGEIGGVTGPDLGISFR